MSEEKICHLVKTSLVDFPYHVSCAVFFPGCNLRCPYCYNKSLAVPSEQDTQSSDMVSFSELEDFLLKRKNVLTGIVFSGGEALMHKDTVKLIKMSKKIGYKVKLDTNGTLPDKLESLFLDPATKPDYLAIDIKTSPSKYKDLIPLSPSDFEERLTKTLKIAFSMPLDNLEIRTVLVPSLVVHEDLKNIASFLPEKCKWFLSRFKSGNCLDEHFNTIAPYSQTELDLLVEYAKKFISDAKLR